MPFKAIADLLKPIMLCLWVRPHGHWRHYGAPPPAYLACPLAILAAVRHLCSFKFGAMAAKKRAPLALLGGASPLRLKLRINRCQRPTAALWRGSYPHLQHGHFVHAGPWCRRRCFDEILVRTAVPFTVLVQSVLRSTAVSVQI